MSPRRKFPTEQKEQRYWCPHCGGEVCEVTEWQSDRYDSHLVGTGKFTCQVCFTMFSSAPKRKAQHQGALEDQLNELYRAANKLGLYDAADWLQGRREADAKDKEDDS